MPTDPEFPALSRLTADVRAAMHAAEATRGARTRARRFRPLLALALLLVVAVPAGFAIHDAASGGAGTPDPGSPVARAIPAVVVAQGATGGTAWTIAARRCDGATPPVALVATYGGGAPDTIEDSACAGSAGALSTGERHEGGVSLLYGVGPDTVVRAELTLLRTEAGSVSPEPAGVARVATRPLKVLGDVDLPAGYRFFAVARQSRDPLTIGLATALDRQGRAVATSVPAFPSTPSSTSISADPGGLQPWVARATEWKVGSRAGQTCVQVTLDASPKAGVPSRGAILAPACGRLGDAGVFARTVRTGRTRTVTQFTNGPDDPRRTILFGAVSPDVETVTVRGAAGGRRTLPIGRPAGAFVAVFDETTDPADLTLDVTHRTGQIFSFENPVAVNRVTSRRPAPRPAGPLRLRITPEGSRSVVLRMTLTGRATRFEATFLGREVRMEPVSTTSTGLVSYRGVYDGTRGVRRSVAPGPSGASLVICGSTNCTTHQVTAELR